MELIFACTLLYGLMLSAEGSCVISELPKTDVCRADVECTITTEDLNLINDRWPCIKRLRSDYYYHNNMNRYIYDTNYQLNLNVENVDISVSEDPLTGTEYKANNIIKLSVNNGNLNSLPIQIYNLRILRELKIVQNKLEVINLIKLSSISTLEVLNCSHNSISRIDIPQTEIVASVNMVNKIDLSHNALEYLPDNCFVTFNRLRYLDLSHNKILKFDILTFEGMTHLETLFLSNNKLTEIGQNFARFINLKKFALDNNYLTSLSEKELRKLIAIENFNVSSNRIKNIENSAFATFINLQELDLSNNEITSIHKELFVNNNQLSNLLLSNNNIEQIEGGSFSEKNISKFQIYNNNLSGAIERDTFEGIYVSSLDLSSGTLSRLGDNAFSSIGKNLLFLNLSRNSLDTIAKTSFQSLKLLLKLDLSNNKLNDIQFNTSDLISLTEYCLKNNKLKKIENAMFKDLHALKKLDISGNTIIVIESTTFTQLNTLVSLILQGNLLNSLKANIFDGLSSLGELDISFSNIVRFKNESLSGVNFTKLNSSHSDIEVIEYESFKGSVGIKSVDLSFNMLEQFHVNTSYLSRLTELYLNNNKLKYVTNSTFKNLFTLQKLYLYNNNIINVNSNAFQTLYELKFLNLQNNYALTLSGHVLDNLTLSKASFSNIKGNIIFADTVNISITILDMANCNISDINKISVFNIQNTLQLNVSFNNITTLDKWSLRKMPLLNWLDLSFNTISFIQPGTFLFTKMINTLNLQSNNLLSLQFGVLDGLENLNILNLRNNALHVFDAKLLHSTPQLAYLFLDDNIITNLDIHFFLTTNLQLLSIGGNLVPCKDLISIKNENNSFVIHKSDGELTITTNHFEYNAENVQGITCKTQYISGAVDQRNIFNDTTNVTELATVIKELHDYFNMSKIMFENIRDIKMELVTYVIALTEFVNKSNIPLDTVLKTLSDIHRDFLKDSNNQGGNITESLKMMTSILKSSSDYTLLTNKYLEEQNKALNNTINGIHMRQDYIPQSYKGPIKETHDVVDMKVLYVIIACLIVIIVFNIVSLFTKYIFKWNQLRRTQDQILRSNECSMEME